MQVPQELTIRGCPQLSEFVSGPQFLPRREQKAALVSGAQPPLLLPELPLAEPLWLPEAPLVPELPVLPAPPALPELETVPELPVLAAPLALPEVETVPELPVLPAPPALPELETVPELPLVPELRPLDSLRPASMSLPEPLLFEPVRVGKKPLLPLSKSTLPVASWLSAPLVLASSPGRRPALAARASAEATAPPSATN